MCKTGFVAGGAESHVRDNVVRLKTERKIRPNLQKTGDAWQIRTSQDQIEQHTLYVQDTNAFTAATNFLFAFILSQESVTLI